MKNKENLKNMKITKMQHKLLNNSVNSFMISQYKKRYDFMDDIIEEQTYDSQTDKQIFDEQDEQVEEQC